jgi:hypothetical protein
VQPAGSVAQAAESTTIAANQSGNAPTITPVTIDFDVPSWLFVNGSASIMTLSEDNIRTIMKSVHKVLKPHLTADLLKRHPGECASHDHTFKVAARVLGDANAYAFWLGERHDIFWHGATRTTSWDELVPAAEACERRFKRLGVSGELKHWWDDLCCCGKAADRLHEHAVVHAFPGVIRCPYKDPVQLVTASTFNSGTGEMDVYSREVGAVLRSAHENDVLKAVDHIVATEGLTRVEARSAVRAQRSRSNSHRSHSPHPGRHETLPAPKLVSAP